MLQMKHLPDKGEETNVPASKVDRRNFLSKMLGATVVTVSVASCTKSLTGAEANDQLARKASLNSLSPGSINLGSGDYAVLNFAYLLEQLEAQFYTMATNHCYNNATDWEKKRLMQIRNHEIAHREFFKTALGSYAIPSITFNLSSVDFSSRESVLKTARTFEDLGVGAYNGAGRYISTPAYLTLAGKIVSVEARHAAYIRDLLVPVSFASSDVVSVMGLDKALHPNTVLHAAGTFLPSSVTINTSQAPW